MWPPGYGQIHTSCQAGGITSSSIRVEDLRIVDALPVVVDVAEAPPAPDAPDAGARADRAPDARRLPARGRRVLTQRPYPRVRAASPSSRRPACGRRTSPWTWRPGASSAWAQARRRRRARTASRLARSAAMRSGTGSASSSRAGCTAISSPDALRSMSASTSSRYVSRNLPGSNSDDSDSTSCLAMSTSRSRTSTSSARGMSSIVPGSMTSSAKTIVLIAEDVVPSGGSRRAAPSSG